MSGDGDDEVLIEEPLAAGSIPPDDGSEAGEQVPAVEQAVLAAGGQAVEQVPAAEQAPLAASGEIGASEKPAPTGLVWIDAPASPSSAAAAPPPPSLAVTEPGPGRPVLTSLTVVLTRTTGSTLDEVLGLALESKLSVFTLLDGVFGVPALDVGQNPDDPPWIAASGPQVSFVGYLKLEPVALAALRRSEAAQVTGGQFIALNGYDDGWVALAEPRTVTAADLFVCAKDVERFWPPVGEPATSPPSESPITPDDPSEAPAQAVEPTNGTAEDRRLLLVAAMLLERVADEWDQGLKESDYEKKALRFSLRKKRAPANPDFSSPAVNLVFAGIVNVVRETMISMKLLDDEDKPPSPVLQKLGVDDDSLVRTVGRIEKERRRLRDGARRKK